MELLFQKSFDKEVSEAMLKQAEPGSTKRRMEISAAEQRRDLYALLTQVRVSRCALTRSTFAPGPRELTSALLCLHHTEEDLCLLLFPFIFLLIINNSHTPDTVLSHRGQRSKRQSLLSSTL